MRNSRWMPGRFSVQGPEGGRLENPTGPGNSKFGAGGPGSPVVVPPVVCPRAGDGCCTLTNSPAAETVVLPKSVPDPLEPLNRVMWAFNVGLMTDVIKPTSKVYRFVVVKPVRTGIGNFGRNLTYPGRLINNLLQGKWSGARDESYRFVCNTTVGVAGFWDVASKWKIPKSDADFGQTFGQWGWKPELLFNAADFWTEQ